MILEGDGTSFHTWEFIWSMFMKSPRARAWLFSREPPPKHQVYHALQTCPKLLGFEFSPLKTKQLSSNVPFPDIGDLSTVYTIDGCTILGFNFGFRGVQPYIPPVQAVTKSDSMKCSKAIVRRYARRLVHTSEIKCFLSLEFSWLESGALTIATCINPLPGHMHRDDYPYYDHMDFRFYTPPAAYRLSELNNLAGVNASSTELPPDLLFPKEDYSGLRVREPPFAHSRSDVEDLKAKEAERASWPRPKHSHFDNIAEDRAATVVDLPEMDIPAVVSEVTGRGIPSRHSYANSRPSVKCNLTTMRELWSVYRHGIRNARPTGTYMSVIGQTRNFPVVNREVISARYGNYRFMCHPITDYNRTKIRVQWLCQYLGISCSSPVVDRPLMAAPGYAQIRSVKGRPSSFVDAESGSHDGKEQQATNINRQDDDAVSHLQSPGGEEDSIAMQGVTLANMAEDIAAECKERKEMEVRSPGHSLSFISGSSLLTGHQEDGPAVVVENAQAVRMNDEILPGPAMPEMRWTAHGNMNHAAQGPSSGSYGFVNSNHNLDVQNIRSNGYQGHQVSGEDEQFKSGPTTSMSADRNERLSSFASLGVPDAAGRFSGAGTENSVPMLEDQRTEEKMKTRVRTEDDNLNSDKNFDGGHEVGRKRKATCEAEGAPESKWSNMIWTCDRCGAKIRGKRGNLNRHIASKHDNVRAFVCERYGCARRFQTRLNLVRHVTAVHEGRPYACSKCPRAFKASEDREAHFRTAHLQCGGRLSCTICGGCFGRRSTLNRHMANVHKARCVT